MPSRATTPEPDGGATEPGGAATDTAPAPPLYGDKPVFTYTPKDGGDPIVFPAHSTIRGEINGIKYLEFLWEIDELSSADQIFAYLRRSGATKAMQRRCVRLDDEVTTFFRDWINASDDDEVGLPGES